MKEIQIDKTCAFTGHRFYKSKSKENIFNSKYKNYTQIEIDYIKFKLEEEILKLFSEGYVHFISGGALGVDTWAIDILIKLKKSFEITYEIAMPYPNQSNNWPKDNKTHHLELLKMADKITVVNKCYHVGCMQKRNRYMVNNSSVLIAVYSDTKKGGTYYTIEYAKSLKRKIILIKEF